MKKNKIELLYEDEHLVVVQKPADYLSIPDRFDATKPNLYHYFQKVYEQIFIVHRLDKETSGLICFARTEAAHRHLSQQFSAHTVAKKYLALVEGQAPKEGVIEKPISHHPTIAGKMVVSKRGKASLTTFEVVERFRNYSLVEATIKTGRTHQIRVHFEAIGYPMAVDAMYGRQLAFYLSSVKLRKYKKTDEEERPLMSRTSLHSHRLGLIHPATGEAVEFTAPLPKDFKAVVNQLRKWGQ